MIEFGKITGEVENNLMQVKMRTGESLFAPMAIVGTGVSIPSLKWVTANKDNFLALVTYEKDILENPIVVGFYPVKGAVSATYNTTERLLLIVKKLLEQLSKAKINTQIGPQQFMPDTLLVLEQLSANLMNVEQDINQIKL